MPKGTVEIVEFDPRQAIPAALARSVVSQERSVRHDLLSRLRLNHRTATSVTVAFAVIALHAFILAPLTRGSGAAAAPPPQFGTPDTIHAVLIDDRSASAITPPSAPPPVLRPIRFNVPEVPSRSNAPSGLAALYGRYLGQMDARIERAWLRPRSAIGAPRFRCQVEIWQRRDGTVQTVTLQRCNGTTRWQLSLVQGITAASPLPAPPDPRLFAHRVVLHFEAGAYRAGELADAYEPEQSRASATDTEFSEPLTQLLLLRQAAKGSAGPSVAELRIEGSRIEVKPRR